MQLFLHFTKQQLANLLKQSEPAQLVPVTDEKFQLLWPRPKSMIKKEGEPLKLKPHFLIRVIAGTTGPEGKSHLFSLQETTMGVL